MATWTPTSAGNGTSLAVDIYGRTGTGYGSDALDPDNPEIIASDDTEVDLNHFGSGVHAYQFWSGGSDQWRDAGVVLRRSSAFAGGQAAQAQIRVKIEFLLEAIDTFTGGSAPLIAVAGLDESASDALIEVEMVLVSGTGTGSLWRIDLNWERFSTGGGMTASSADITYADLQVGTTRDLMLCVHCTSAHQTEFPVTPQDGSILLTMDGVELVSITGIDPYLHWEMGNPSVLNSWNTVGLGYAGLLGPTWMVSASDICEDDEEPPEEYVPVENVSDPCACDADAPVTPTVNPYGPHNPGASTTTCVGEGTVPTAADLTDPEDWRTLNGATPNVLCELFATKHPSVLGEDVYRWSDQGLDLPAEPAFVEGRVRRGGWMEIRRAMALPDQYPEISRAGVVIDEQDALIRTLLDTDSTSYLTGREWVQWLVSETRRKASGTMSALFRGVVSAFNPGPGRTYTIEADDQLAAPGGVFDQEKLIPQAVIDYDFFGPGGDGGTDIHPTRYGGEFAGQLTRGAHKDLIGTPIPIIGGICSDRGALSIDGLPAEHGSVPLIWVRDCYVEPHLDQLWGELLVCIGEVAGIEDVYGSDLGYDGASPADPPRASKRININATAGVDLLCPGMSGWPFAENYRERTVNGQTLRYTAVYLRGPRMEEHRLGILTATANVCGPMGLNDQVINQAGPFLQWFLNEHVAKDGGAGYRSGEYHTLETYASDASVPYLQPTTFDEFVDYTKERLSDDTGYVVTNFQLRQQFTLRELEKRFMQDYEVSFPINRQGQKMLRWPNWSTDPTAGTLYRERIEIDEPLPPFRDAHDEVENVVGFVCDYDHVEASWRREPEFLRDEDSIEAHHAMIQGGRRLADGRTPQPFEVWSTADIGTVRDTFSRRLARKGRAPRYQQVPSDLFALNDELGDPVRLTHSRGVGANGYQERSFQVLQQLIDPNRYHVSLVAMDLVRFQEAIAVSAPDDAPDFSMASEEDLAFYAYAAADDGTVGDEPGKRAT